VSDLHGSVGVVLVQAAFRPGREIHLDGPGSDRRFERLAVGEKIMLTKEQIEERKGYLGSSDAAAVLGLSRWKSPLSVWAEKTGQVVPEDISGKLQVKLGHKLEQAVAELFMEETGLTLHRVNETIFHKKYPFIAANIDRRIVGHNAVVEIKNIGAWSRDQWADGGAPDEYIAQVFHQLAVTGWDRGYLVALIGNSDLKIVPIERNEAALKELVRQEVEFWESYVVPKVMPVKFSRLDKGTLDALFPTASEGKTVELTDTEASAIEYLEGLREDKRNVEGNIEKIENQLRAALGDAETGVVGDHKVFWSNLTVKRLDVEELKAKRPEVYAEFAKPNTQRRFLIKTIKKELSNVESK
jgi:putative phage-type endonuclease